MKHHQKVALLDNIYYTYNPLDPNETGVERCIQLLDAALAAAHADGIEAARRAVAEIPHGTSWFSSFIEDALAAIDSIPRTIGDALTAESDTEGGE